MAYQYSPGLDQMSSLQAPISYSPLSLDLTGSTTNPCLLHSVPSPSPSSKHMCDMISHLSDAKSLVAALPEALLEAGQANAEQSEVKNNEEDDYVHRLVRESIRELDAAKISCDQACKDFSQSTAELRYQLREANQDRQLLLHRIFSSVELQHSASVCSRVSACKMSDDNEGSVDGGRGGVSSLGLDSIKGRRGSVLTGHYNSLNGLPNPGLGSANTHGNGQNLSRNTSGNGETHFQPPTGTAGPPGPSGSVASWTGERGGGGGGGGGG
eukprot:CAMPEP_0206539444 /NCGR_PEP_ID=MMETSP0325_2-20121206/8434_1 /ASSEMBLY_ACC=CAM_ASM_000347 /TAXON_ID=2866 /ORGANISM="Crypthecodinium cohnii, Strain Seligo" /LENGTH=268 /DNA_ID=CAMNT_0054037019 /DNA_START=69 /DNA_END=872 /DNA_ORIENTATION=+